eukprot:2009888-Prymnesium_polylepis.1
MATTDGPAGKRQEKLILGCYVDYLFTAYSHDDEQSLYHTFTTALQSSWDVEDEGPVSDLRNVEIERTETAPLCARPPTSTGWWQLTYPTECPTPSRRTASPALLASRD